MRLLKNKKGQFYIFIAIVLIAYAFNIARPDPISVEKPDVFKELYENFLTESPIVLNNALYRGENVSAEFTGFVNNYAEYARTRQPNFRLAYLLKNKESLLVGNTLGISMSVTLANESYNLTDNSTLTLTPQDLAIGVAGISYDFAIGTEDYLIKSLFRQKTSTETRIFVNK